MKEDLSKLSSMEIRLKLDEWFKNSKYSKISFTPRLDMSTSLGGMESELLATFQEMGEQIENGTFKTIPLSELKL